MPRSLVERVAKLTETMVQATLKKPTIDVSSWDHDRIIAAIDDAIDPADSELLERIIGHVNALHEIPWQNMTTKERYLDSGGKELPTPHHFTYWIWGLGEGSWHLPRKIPREVLEGFDRLHGYVMFRCEDCLTAFGNARLYETCPVCRSGNLSVRKLSGPPWRHPWEYEGRPRR